MKPGRNDPCSCGSGKKYKLCCETGQNVQEGMKLGRIKRCLHPSQNECQGKIAQAHSIQNNRVLSAISRNGKLYTIDASFPAGRFNIGAVMKGRAIVSTFTGFCSYHDTVLFRPIEQENYQGTSEQHALYAFRAFAFEYHKKSEALQALEKAGYPHSDEMVKAHIASLSWLEYHREQLNKMIINHHYENLYTMPFVYEGVAKVAACSGFFLEFDIRGNALNDVVSTDRDEVRRKMLMINIFLTDKNTVVLISCLIEDLDMYQSFYDQFISFDSNAPLTIVNNLVTCYSENVAIGPDLWDSFTANEQSKYLEYLNYRFSRIDNTVKSKLSTQRPFNIFKDILH